MLIIDEKNNIEITRGNILPLTVGAKNKDGTDYIFQEGDVIRFKYIEEMEVK